MCGGHTEQYGYLRGSLGWSNHRSSGSPILSSVITWPYLLDYSHAQGPSSLEEVPCSLEPPVQHLCPPGSCCKFYCCKVLSGAISAAASAWLSQRGSSHWGSSLERQECFVSFGVRGCWHLLVAWLGWACSSPLPCFPGELRNFVSTPQIPNYARELLADQ